MGNQLFKYQRAHISTDRNCEICVKLYKVTLHCQLRTSAIANMYRSKPFIVSHRLFVIKWIPMSSSSDDNKSLDSSSARPMSVVNKPKKSSWRSRTATNHFILYVSHCGSDRGTQPRAEGGGAWLCNSRKRD